VLFDYASFAILQSRIHEVWARSLSSTMKTDLNYTPSTCFETFPFPKLTPALQHTLMTIGEAFFLTRAELQRQRGLGLTKLWNLVLDPACEDADIQLLRSLKQDMDKAVLAAYGWEDMAIDDGKELVKRLRTLNRRRARGEQA
jgi:hypothetical protein